MRATGGPPPDNRRPLLRAAARNVDAFIFGQNDWRQSMNDDDNNNPHAALSRRRFLKTAVVGAGALAGLAPGMRSRVWAAGSDAPEKSEVKIGFIPLTDCA